VSRLVRRRPAHALVRVLAAVPAVLLAVLLDLPGCSPRGERPAPAEAAPRLVPTAAGVRWEGAALSGSDALPEPALARWWRAAADTGLAGTAVLVPLADSLAAHGDSVRADSLLASPRLARSLWAWDALARRAEWAAAEPVRAARLLDAAERSRWSGAEEAAWRARRARVHLDLRDTVSAEALARAVLEDHATAAPASGEALALLDTLARLRGERFALRLERRAALAEWANGGRDRALARNARVLRLAAADERVADAFQRVQWLRGARRARAAVAATDTLLRWSRGTPAFDRARLERARSFRAAGRSDSALALFQRVGRTAATPALRATAWWECGREAQDESRWALAARAFHAADSLGAGLASVRGAASLAGLMEWVQGHEAAALRRWRAADDRRARFWLGVALRRRGEAAGDSILREEFALRPGYDWLAIAARDTLGLPSWHGRVVAAAPDTLEPDLVAAIVALSGPLRLPDLAARLVSSRDRRDPRLPPGPRRALGETSWRAIAVASYAGGDLAGATRAADRALLAAAGDTSAWAWVPWAYPPAYESEVREAATRFGLEPALLWGLARQESRFDTRAVSRSRALGLTQLLPGTAREVAAALRESLPSDSLVFEPDRGLRYGAYYLHRLLRRFDGSVPVALTAYNAGAGRVRKDWRELLARGGWALYAEMASNADTQDYVRRILGYRQAYLELRPTAVAP